MRVAFKDHRGMGLRLADLLEAAGHEIVGPLEAADIALTDHSVPWGLWQMVADLHEKVVVYPHGGGLICRGDGQHPDHPNTVATLVCGEGLAQLLGECGNRQPTYVVGCTFAERAPFRPLPEVGRLRVLFAPDHEDPSDGVEIAQHLMDLNVDVTVRTNETTRDHPLQALSFGNRQPDVTFGPLTVQGAVAAVDAHDVVVTGSHTMLAVAVAGGVPAVAYHQPSDGADTVKFPARHPRLWSACCYPVDATPARDGHDMLALIALAANENVVREWREDFVGADLDPEAFVKLIESLA